VSHGCGRHAILIVPLDDLTAEPTPPRRATRRPAQIRAPDRTTMTRGPAKRIEGVPRRSVSPARRRLEARAPLLRGPIVFGATDADMAFGVSAVEGSASSGYGRPGDGARGRSVASDVTSVPPDRARAARSVDAIRHEVRARPTGAVARAHSHALPTSWLPETW
jgi:hypothetical protein